MTIALLFIVFMIFATRRLLSYLHFYQQDEYDSKRFSKWLIKERNIDKKLTFVVVALSLFTLFAPIIPIEIILIVVFAGFAWIESNPLRQAKKPLVLTGRAKRILYLSILCMALVGIFTARHAHNILICVIAIHIIPFMLMVSNHLLASYEASINQGFRKEAVKKLEQINPFVIGITGSYGKTSVKHILGHVLQNFAPTFITPGGINTEMGIVRVIREQLKPHHKFFVVEMGAYGIGSIARLCALTPPNMSLITSIGPAHFERFKSLENTARAKFEIAEAALLKQGKTIIHESALAEPYARQFQQQHVDSFIVCGTNGEAKIIRSTQTKNGLEIVLEWKGKEYTLKPSLFGLHQVGNVVLSFVAAVELGMEPEDVVLSLQSVPQIKHRLEVKSVGNYTLIDDAYNSNPSGFEAALDALDVLGRDTRRILVTPGMVELGEKHSSEHARLGQIAADKTDIVLVVKADRIPDFVQAYTNKAPNKIMIKVSSFQEAEAWLMHNRQANDVVLLENDLPDLYERKLEI